MSILAGQKGSLRVLTHELAVLLSPMIWCDISTPITDDEILAYDGPASRLPPYEWKLHTTESQMRLEHIQRIVALTRNPDTWEPLDLLDGSDDEDAGHLTLDDGHHRVRAAQLLDLPSLPIRYCGLWQTIRTAFPASYRAGMLRQSKWRSADC